MPWTGPPSPDRPPPGQAHRRFYAGEIVNGLTREVAAAGGRTILVQAAEPDDAADLLSAAELSLPVGLAEVDAVVSVAPASTRPPWRGLARWGGRSPWPAGSSRCRRAGGRPGQHDARARWDRAPDRPRAHPDRLRRRQQPGHRHRASSLAAPRTFPVDALKIEGSFVRELDVVMQATELVRIIIAMGDVLGMEVVAECVETTRQALSLRVMGCANAQGWLYAPALPGDRAGAVLGTRLPAASPLAAA